jgi:uncharacterized coiled-coil protein SlyX
MKFFSRFVESELRLQLLMEHIEHLNMMLSEQSMLIKEQRFVIELLQDEIKTLKKDGK